MAAISNREILFVLKMQNQSRQAIKEMAGDLGNLAKSLETVDKKSDKAGASGGVKKLSTGLKEVVAEANNAADAIRKTATDGESSLNKATDATKEYVSQVKTLPSVYGPAVEEALRLAGAADDAGEAVTKSMETTQREGRRAAEVLGKVAAITADLEEVDLFAGTAYRDTLGALEATGSAGYDLAAQKNDGVLREIYAARTQALEVLRAKYKDMGITAQSTEKEILNAARITQERLKRLGDEAKETGNKLDNMASPGWLSRMLTLKNLLIGVVGALAGSALIREADAWKRLTGQIKLTTSSEANLLAVRQRVVDISQKTMSDLESTGQLYVRIAQRADILGKSQAEVADMVETVSMAMQVGGSTAQESASALRQFSQALGRGALRGDELNSIIENSPGLAKAFEDGLRAAGHEVRSLKQYIDEAEPEILDLLDALMSQSGQVAEEFAKLPVRVEQGVTVLSNAFTVFVGSMDEASGATDGLGKFLMRIAQIIQSEGFIEFFAGLANVIGKVLNAALTVAIGLINGMSAAFNFAKENVALLSGAVTFLLGLLIASKWGVFITWVTKMTGAIIGATKAVWAFNTALLANPATWVIALIAGLVAAIVYLGNKTQEVNGVMITGWAAVKANAIGTFVALSTGAAVLWRNLKKIFGGIVGAIYKTAAAWHGFRTGNLTTAVDLGREAVDSLTEGVGNLENAWTAAGKAGAQAARESVFNSAFALPGDATSAGSLSTESGEPLLKPEEAEDSDSDADTAAKARADAIKALRERTEETRFAIIEQGRLNAAVLEGPAAIRELEAALAGEREMREALKALKDADVDVTEGSEGYLLAEASARAAIVAELVKQREAYQALHRELDDAILDQEEMMEQSRRASDALFLQGRAYRELGYQMEFAARRKELMAGFVADELDDEEANARANEAAREFAEFQESMRNKNIAAQLLAESRTEAELAAEAYREARTAFEEWIAEGARGATAEQVARIQAHLDSIRPPQNIAEAMFEGLETYMREIQPSLAKVGDLVAGMADRIGNAFTELVLTGKANFGELARSIIADITAMIMKALIFKAIMGLTGGAGGPLGFLLGGSSGGGGFPGPPGFPVGHAGGLASAANATRAVDPSVFANARRYHTGGLAGLRSKEVPIIAKENEAILPTVRLPDGNFGVKASMGDGGGRGGVFAPNININLPDGKGASRTGDLSQEQQEQLGRMLEEELNIHMQRKLDEWTRPGGQLMRATGRR